MNKSFRGAKGDYGLAPGHVTRPMRQRNHAGNMAENGAFSGPKMRHFSVLGAGAARHKPLIRTLLCRPTFLAPQSRKNVGRQF